MRRLQPGPVASADTAAELQRLYAYPAAPRPWVRANMVASADGAATVRGHSHGLSGPADSRVFQLLRGMSDVVLAGAGTVRAEGYRAVRAKREWQEMRHAAGQSPAPALAVVSHSLDLDPAGGLFTEARPGADTVVLTCESAPADRQRALGRVADVVLAGETAVDLGRAVDALEARGYGRVLCEGGPRLLAEIAAAGRLDELCLTLSPLLVSGGAQRILNGSPLPPTAPMHLAHVLEEDGYLLLRYTRETPEPSGATPGKGDT